MTVRKRKDGRWQLDIVIHRRGEKVRIREACGAGVTNRKLALEAERKRRLELEGGAPAGKSPIFSEHLEEMHRVVTRVRGKHSTVQTERSLIDNHLLVMLGDRRIDEIDHHEIAIFTAELVEKELAPGTVNNVLKVLGKALRLAVKWGLLAKAPSVERVRDTPERPDFLDFEETARLLAAFDPGWRTMALCAMRAGLRAGELAELRWLDVDLVKGVLHVQRNVYRGKVGTPKGGKAREIPLGAELHAELKKRKQLHDPKDLVFGHPSGRHYTAPEQDTPLHRACKRAGLRLIGWHTLRHTFASHLVMRGASLKTVQDLLGHARIEQTMIYAHLTPEVRREAVMLLDEPAPGAAKKNERTG